MKYSLRSLMTFSIRDLFWITVVVALGLGWFCHWRVQEGRYEKRGEYGKRLKDELRMAIYEREYIRDILERNGRRYVIPHHLGSRLPADLENEP